MMRHDGAALRVLYIGGTGTISTSCVRLSVESGMSVFVLNRGNNSAARGLPEGVTWLTGDVTWSAPRVLALAFIPALAIGVLAINAALAMNLQPRPGQEGMVQPGLIGTGLLFLMVQRLHFWLIEKTLRRGDG